MATKNLSGLFTPSGDKITSEAWSKQFINNLGIPVVMADMVGVSYTVSSGKDDMGDTIQVATIVTLENKLNEINSAIAAKGTGTVKKISINGTEKTPDANGVVNLGTGFLTSTDVTNKGASLTPNTTVTLATIGGKNITAVVPAHKLSITTPTATQEQGTAPLTISANPSITTNAASAEENISIQNIKLLGVDTNTKVTVNGVEIGLSVVNNKICLTHSGSEVVPEVHYATLSTSTNSLVINDGATSNQFTISQQYLTGVSLNYSKTNATSYFAVSYSVPNTFTVTKKNIAMTAGTDYTCDIYLTGTPETGANTSKLSVQTVSLTIKAPAAPVSKPITAISMTSPKTNYSAAATQSSTYTCSKTITPSDFTAGGPVTLSLYTNAAHTTKYTGSNVSVVNGDKLQFTGPDKVYPRYEAANGVNTNSTQYYVEYKQTASQFDLASDTTSVTIGGSDSTVNLTTTGIKYYTANPVSNSYFTVDTSDLSKVKITPVSSYALDSVKQVNLVLSPSLTSGWYDSSATAKTLKVTVNPKAAAHVWYYAGSKNDIKASNKSQWKEATNGDFISSIGGDMIAIITDGTVTPNTMQFYDDGLTKEWQSMCSSSSTSWISGYTVYYDTSVTPTIGMKLRVKW